MSGKVCAVLGAGPGNLVSNLGGLPIPDLCLIGKHRQKPLLEYQENKNDYSFYTSGNRRRYQGR